MSTKNEYERFLTWLRDDTRATDDAKRVANIVYANFAAVERTSSNQGQRARVLAPRLITGLAQAEPSLPPLPAATSARTFGWNRLRKLVVGPFRGFRVAETFDLDKRIVLFYGPNGTGKTSLCEALEHGLLGQVEEAGAKRIASNDYLRNVYARSFVAPTLTGTDANGNEVRVTSDLDSLRFCFVEKNRIDAFSRIAARTPAQRLELIAALFGLEGFTDFVRNFNADIDQHLTSIDVKGRELAQKRQSLTIDQNTINTEATQRAALVATENALAAEYHTDITYEGLLTLIGSAEKPGRLQELDGLLAVLPPAQYGISVQSVQGLRDAAQAAQVELATFNQQLESRRSEVNFKSLYEALQGLEPDGLDYCPACTTPLVGEKAALRNPFERAREGLAQLAELATLQRQQGDAKTAAGRASQELRNVLLRVCNIGLTDNLNPAPLREFMGSLPAEVEGEWWRRLDGPSIVEGSDNPARSPWETALELARRGEISDAAVRNQIDGRERQAAESARLRQFQIRVTQQAMLQTQLTEAVAAAKARVNSFNEDNQALITAVETERTTIEYHRRVRNAYAAFLARLKAYREHLPEALTTNLSETALSLYNDFNRYDHDSDRLSKLILPTDEHKRILIAFNSHPDDMHDALQIMSEGHIRCLGLAILLAKNIKQNCPVLIFDDAVNAIDNEHRLGIRDTLFENAALDSKQIILTCHGEELIKDIEVHIGNRAANDDCLSYTFLPHDGDRVIKVVPGETRNYVLSARNHFAAGRVRDSLGDVRRATEAVCFRTWQFLHRVGHGELRLKQERARAPVELHDLATQLKKKIDAAAFTHERKASLAEGYERMLGAREWAVLNPGTHEAAGIEDFPRETVRTVIENLTALDNVLSGR